MLGRIAVESFYSFFSNFQKDSSLLRLQILFCMLDPALLIYNFVWISVAPFQWDGQMGPILHGMGNGWDRSKMDGNGWNFSKWMEWGSKWDFFLGMKFSHVILIIWSYLAVWPDWKKVAPNQVELWETIRRCAYKQLRFSETPLLVVNLLEAIQKWRQPDGGGGGRGWEKADALLSVGGA